MRLTRGFCARCEMWLNVEASWVGARLWVGSLRGCLIVVWGKVLEVIENGRLEMLVVIWLQVAKVDWEVMHG